MSLAAFDPGKVKCEWYNVLSFKFMQSESALTKAKTQDQHNKGSSTVVTHQQTDALSVVSNLTYMTLQTMLIISISLDKCMP